MLFCSTFNTDVLCFFTKKITKHHHGCHNQETPDRAVVVVLGIRQVVVLVVLRVDCLTGRSLGMA